jgi:serine/threonine-protein kinase
VNPGSFFAELKRRNVVRMAGLYLVGAWLLTQVASTVLPMFGAPEWLPRSIVILLAIGFIPALIFSWAFELTPQGLKRDEDVAPEQSIAPQTARRMDRMIIAVLVLALAYFAFDKFVLGPRRPGASSESSSSANSQSIAVLPFVNMSSDKEQEYFSDGLSEELIAVLAKIPGLKIIGRNSSFLFKGKSEDSRTIGQKLGVANLLEGSVRKQVERVRIVAELINAADGRQLWSETYDRELKDVFAVQSEIARAVAEQMKVKLLGQTTQSDAMPSNENLAAHNAVLQADFYFQQQTGESVQRAITFLQEAVQLDPKYGFAYARLSQSWRQYGASYATDDAEQAYTEARKAAEMATKLAPDLVESHKALGWVAMTPALDFKTAEKEFRLALATAPGDASAKNALSYALTAQGRLAEAEQVCHEAIALDPLLTVLWYNLGRIAVGTGRYQEAEAVFRKGLELQPRAARFHTYLAALALLRNDPAEALQHAQLESEGFWRDYARTLVQQAEPDRAVADSALKIFSEKYKTSASFQIAFLHAMRKEPDEVFEWLDTAYAVHDSGLTQLVVTPFLIDYRNDPRFIALCQKLRVQIPAARAKP